MLSWNRKHHYFWNIMHCEAKIIFKRSADLVFFTYHQFSTHGTSILWSRVRKCITNWQIQGPPALIPCRNWTEAELGGVVGCIGTVWSSSWTLKKIRTKNIFSSWRKLILKISNNFFFENFLKIFRRKNVFWGILKIIPKSKIENLIFDFRFWDDFQNFPKKYFFDEQFSKNVHTKKLFEIFKIIFLHDEKIFFVRIFFKSPRAWSYGSNATNHTS